MAKKITTNSLPRIRQETEPITIDFCLCGGLLSCWSMCTEKDADIEPTAARHIKNNKEQLSINLFPVTVLNLFPVSFGG